MLAHGDVIAGRYQVDRPLGAGASKQVYLARDLLTGEQFALAVFAQTGETSAQMTQRFAREGRIGTALSSPYIVRVVDAGLLSDGTYYLVTEAMLGRSLEDALVGGPVAPELAARWTMQVLAGLEAAHRLGVVHRDVKPDNVLLARTAAGDVAKLTDFGIAKIVDGNFDALFSAHTSPDVLLGTPQYMSPEQWTGKKIDGRADVYAVGCMLHELLTGQTPFADRGNLLSLSVAHMMEEPPAIAPDAPALVRALSSVARRALAKNPDERFASAAAMRAAVEVAAGVRLADLPVGPELVLPATFARAELLGDTWPAPVQLVSAPQVVLGSDPGAHVMTRCLPDTPGNAILTATVSPQHARITWRGGRAVVADLGSEHGTFAAGRPAGLSPVELCPGDEIALGPYVRLRFDHAAAAIGELPRWATLVRTDAFGAGQAHLLVLTEATISADADAAIRVGEDVARGEAVRLAAHGVGLAVSTTRALDPTPLHEGQLISLGRATILVAIQN